MENKLAILQGFTNLVLQELGVLDKEISAEGKRKMEMCMNCPFDLLNKETFKCGKTNSELKALGKKRVSKEDGCGCKMPAKVLTNEKCPTGQW